MPDDPGADRLAVAGDDVEDAGGDHLLRQLHEPERRQRRLLGRLQHLDVARRQCRRELPDAHHQRVVPWRDPADDPERLAADPRRVAAHVLAARTAFEDARRAGEEADVVGHDRRLFARDGDRLAGVHRLELSQLLGVLVDQVGQLEQDLRALGRSRLEPLGQRLLRRLDGAVDVRLRPARYLGDRLAGRGVQHLHRFALDGAHPLAADEVLIGRSGDAHRKPPLEPLSSQRRIARSGRQILPHGCKPTRIRAGRQVSVGR